MRGPISDEGPQIGGTLGPAKPRAPAPAPAPERVAPGVVRDADGKMRTDIPPPPPPPFMSISFPLVIVPLIADDANAVWVFPLLP
jgi:hypothetical protein